MILALLLCLTFDERDEVERLAPKYSAQTEVQLWDGTRVDMLNNYYAFEVDWSRKWAEGIGQALYYAEVTNRKPALLLLYRDRRKEAFYIFRAQTVCAKYNIRLYLEKVK